MKVITDCIVNDIHVCLKNNAPTGAIILTYCAMDTMAFLYMAEGKQNVVQADFKNWIDKYMQTDAKQPYQYNAEDLYGARCGIVHTYGAESDLSRKSKCKRIGYAANCLEHFYDPAKQDDVVILSVELFIRDFYDAIDNFLADIDKDEGLRRRVETRLPRLYHRYSKTKT